MEHFLPLQEGENPIPNKNERIASGNLAINPLKNTLNMKSIEMKKRARKKSILYKDIRIIILYAVPISLWPTLGKENRYF